jgi:ubiquinone/menaquinone biosynthesis C-methylase UbiE
MIMHMNSSLERVSSTNMSQALYELIGQGYDQTRKADTHVTERLLHHLQLQPGERYLDVGCGTGNYTATLAGEKRLITGVDPSESMIKQAEEKYPNLPWVLGRAESLPFEDGAFQGAFTTLTIHLWENLIQGFKEIHRVVSEGRLVIFTSMPHQMKRYWLNAYFPSVIAQSMRMMPGFDSLQATLDRAGWRLCASEKFFVNKDIQDMIFFSGKHNPEIYFESTVRSSISYFAAADNQAEVEQGLERLREDLDSGHFETVRQQYANDFGDYMFIVAEKKA